MRAESRLLNVSHIQDLGWSMVNILDLRPDWFHGRSLDLSTALNDFGIQECSDTRDRIYGLLGLMKHKPFGADYSKTCLELFLEVVCQLADIYRANNPQHYHFHYNKLCVGL